MTKVINLKMTRGDTFKRNFKLETDNKEEINLDNLTKAYFTVKADIDNEEFLFQKKIGAGITVSDNLIHLRIESEDTSSLEADTYYYDLEVTFGEDVYTPLKGNFVVEWDVTGGTE